MKSLSLDQKVALHIGDLTIQNLMMQVRLEKLEEEKLNERTPKKEGEELPGRREENPA